jgi:hypothetical protein
VQGGGEEGFAGRGDFPQGGDGGGEVGGAVAEIGAEGDGDAGHAEILNLNFKF